MEFPKKIEPETLHTSCPHCLKEIVLVLELAWGPHSQIDFRWGIKYGLCPGCLSSIIFLINIQQHPTKELISIRLIQPRSSGRKPPPPEVLEEFTKDYLAACRVLQDSPEASAAMSRRGTVKLFKETIAPNLHFTAGPFLS